MAYSLGNHTHASGGTSYTSPAIDTTGADILWAAVSDYTGGSGITLSDSQSNTWTGLTPQSNGETRIRLFYCQAPTTSASHTFTITSGGAFSALAVLAAVGSVATPLDQTTGATTGGATSLNAGSVTPSENNEIIITAWAAGANGASPTVSGYTVIEHVDYAGGTNEGVGLAYLIQTTAGATNPAWNWTNSSVAAAVVATFKDTPGGGGGFFGSPAMAIQAGRGNL